MPLEDIKQQALIAPVTNAAAGWIDQEGKFRTDPLVNGMGDKFPMPFVRASVSEELEISRDEAVKALKAWAFWDEVNNGSRSDEHHKSDALNDALDLTLPFLSRLEKKEWEAGIQPTRTEDKPSGNPVKAELVEAVEDLLRNVSPDCPLHYITAAKAAISKNTPA